jgi:hypothetical protein
MYNSNDYLNAVQFSGATSDYTRMSPIYNAMGYGGGFGMNGIGYGSVFNNTDVNYTQNADGSINYNSSQKPDRLLLGIGALTNIFSAIGTGMMAKDQAQVMQQQQLSQYQAYQQQSAQLAQQQQKQQFTESMSSMLQMMMMMKQFETKEKD